MAALHFGFRANALHVLQRNCRLSFRSVVTVVDLRAGIILAVGDLLGFTDLDLFFLFLSKDNSNKSFECMCARSI
jgi:hypothetical protein